MLDTPHAKNANDDGLIDLAQWSEEEAENSVNWRRQLLTGILGALAGLGLVLAIAYHLSFSSILDQFHRFDWRFLAAVLPLGFSATAGRVVRYCLFFAAKGRLLSLYILFVYMRSLTYVLPFRLGEPVSLYMLKRWGFVSSMSNAAPGWTIIRLGDVIARLILLLPALALMLPREPHSTVWLAGITVSICMILLVLGTWHRWVDVLTPDPKRYTGRLLTIFSEIRLGLINTKSRLRIALSILASLFIAAVNVAVCVCALWALSLPVSLPTATAIVVVAQTIGALPFRPPLGIGLQESVWTGLLVLAGLDGDQAFAGALSVRVVQMSIMAIETVAAAVANLLAGAVEDHPTVQ